MCREDGEGTKAPVVTLGKHGEGRMAASANLLDVPPSALGWGVRGPPLWRRGHLPSKDPDQIAVSRAHPVQTEPELSSGRHRQCAVTCAVAKCAGHPCRP